MIETILPVVMFVWMRGKEPIQIQFQSMDNCITSAATLTNPDNEWLQRRVVFAFCFKR